MAVKLDIYSISKNEKKEHIMASLFFHFFVINVVPSFDMT